jgi:hypothetical protein
MGGDKIRHAGARRRAGVGAQRGSRVQQWRRGMDLLRVLGRGPVRFVMYEGVRVRGVDETIHLQERSQEPHRTNIELD